MKSIVPLFLTAMFVVACSESKNPPEEKKEDASVVVEEKRTVIHEDMKKVERRKHGEVQGKFNRHAECVKSQNVDILKDSVRFKAVFDSCWTVCMPGL